jgi:hypothetical protein
LYVFQSILRINEPSEAGVDRIESVRIPEVETYCPSSFEFGSVGHTDKGHVRYMEIDEEADYEELGLLGLPDEVIVHLLLWLTKHELKPVACTSKRFYEITDSEPVWKDHCRVHKGILV